MAVTPRQNIFTKMGFLIGLLCVALAFIAAAAESSLGRGFYTSANDVLVALNPGKWIAFKLRHSSAFFDTVVLSIFELPGWLIAGFPGLLLIWNCRPHREEVDPNLLESLETFDRLADLAKEEQAANDDPTFVTFDPKDYEDIEAENDEIDPKKYMDEWDPHDILELDEDNDQDLRPQGPEEKMDEARKNLSIPYDKLS